MSASGESAVCVQQWNGSPLMNPRRTPRDPDLEQDLAVRSAHADGVVARPRRSSRGWRRAPVDAVCTGEDPLVLSAEETAVAVEHDHRVLAAVDDEDVVL